MSLSNRQIAERLKSNGPISKAARAQGDDFATYNFIKKVCGDGKLQAEQPIKTELQGRSQALTDEIKQIYQREGQVDFSKFRVLLAARGNTSQYQKTKEIRESYEDFKFIPRTLDEVYRAAMADLRAKEEARKRHKTKVSKSSTFDAVSRDARDRLKSKKYDIPPIGLYTPKFDYVSPERPKIAMAGKSPEKQREGGDILELSPEKPKAHVSNVYIDRFAARKMNYNALTQSVNYSTELPKILSSNKKSASFVDMKKKLGRSPLYKQANQAIYNPNYEFVLKKNNSKVKLEPLSDRQESARRSLEDLSKEGSLMTMRAQLKRIQKQAKQQEISQRYNRFANHMFTRDIEDDEPYLEVSRNFQNVQQSHDWSSKKLKRQNEL